MPFGPSRPWLHSSPMCRGRRSAITRAPPPRRRGPRRAELPALVRSEGAWCEGAWPEGEWWKCEWRENLSGHEIFVWRRQRLRCDRGSGGGPCALPQPQRALHSIAGKVHQCAIDLRTTWRRCRFQHTDMTESTAAGAVFEHCLFDFNCDLSKLKAKGIVFRSCSVRRWPGQIWRGRGSRTWLLIRSSRSLAASWGRRPSKRSSRLRRKARMSTSRKPTCAARVRASGAASERDKVSRTLWSSRAYESTHERGPAPARGRQPRVVVQARRPRSGHAVTSRPYALQAPRARSRRGRARSSDR